MSAPRLVSVIVATRNRPALLAQALASIRALEGPDLAFEILVGDNGVDPETAGVAAAFGATYDHTAKDGCPAARNLAMRRMTGEFVAFLDDDDVWLAGHIRPQIALLDARPELAAAFGQIVVSTQALEPLSQPIPADWPANENIYLKMLSGFFPQVGATVVRGDLARQIGLMDETLMADSDWDWQLRFARDHKVGFVREACAACRSRPRGTFDALQTRRTPHTRRIFLRHALPNLSRWSSPLAVAHSFFGTRAGYYEYFAEAATDRAEAGDRAGARRAIFQTVRYNPFKATRELVRSSALRAAARASFLPWLGRRSDRSRTAA